MNLTCTTLAVVLRGEAEHANDRVPFERRFLLSRDGHGWLRVGAACNREHLDFLIPQETKRIPWRVQGCKPYLNGNAGVRESARSLDR
jgi:hypothetical protein